MAARLNEYGKYYHVGACLAWKDVPRPDIFPQFQQTPKS